MKYMKSIEKPFGAILLDLQPLVTGLVVKMYKGTFNELYINVV